jgi:nucleolar protein 56
MILYLLFETATGFGLYEKQEFDEVNTQLTQVQKSITTMESFSKIVRLKVTLDFPKIDSQHTNNNT